MSNKLDNINVTVNGVSVPAKQLGEGFTFLWIILVVAAFPYALRDMHEQQDLYILPFRLILNIYNYAIGVPLMVPTDYIYSAVNGELCLGLIVVYWIMFFCFITSVFNVIAHYIGKPWTFLITVGPLIIGLLLMLFGVHQRPFNEVNQERAAVQTEERRKQKAEVIAREAQMKIDREERKIWGEPLERLEVMGYQVIFHKYGGAMGNWAARGELAVKKYANKKWISGVSRDKLFSNIASDSYTYLVPIQTCLKKHGYLKGKIDGVFGYKTRAAVEKSIKKISKIDKMSNRSGSSIKLPYSATHMGYPVPAYKEFLKSHHPDCTW